MTPARRSRAIWGAAAAVLGIFPGVLASAGTLWNNGGRDFPVGLYSIGAYAPTSNADMQRAKADGFNLIQSYGFNTEGGYLSPDQYIQAAATHGLNVILPIGYDNPASLNVPAATQANVQHFAAYDNLAWWSVSPEELRYWVPEELAHLQSVSSTVRANDSLNRPVFMYLPTNYGTAAVKEYTPYLDGIGAGAYANYASKPRPFVRWRVETQQNAINQSAPANQVGRFPIGVLAMFPNEQWASGTVPMTGADAYHDAYLSLASGAKALAIYADAYRTVVDPGVYQSYKKVAQELNGPARLGEVYVYGSQVKGLGITINSGPQFSESFTDSFGAEPGNTIQYGSITQRTMAHNGTMYVTAVNSATAAVNASFGSLRNATGNVEVFFESRNIPIAGSQFTDTFAATGVHVYRLPAKAELVVQADPFNNISGWTGQITHANGIATVTHSPGTTHMLSKTLTAGSLPEGGFLELQINAPSNTEFFLSLIAANGSSTAMIDWRAGAGTWETVQVPFAGGWKGTGALSLGIRGAGASYQLDSLGLYFKAPMPKWKADANGTWSGGAHWINGVPNLPDVTAQFGSVITAPRSVQVDGLQTVGGLLFDNLNRYTLAGTGTVSIEVSSGVGSIAGVRGSHTIAAAVALADSTVVTIAQSGDRLTLAGSLSSAAGVSLTKRGEGSLEAGHIRVDALSLDAGLVQVTAGGGTAGTSRVKILSIDATAAKLDLTDHDLVIDYDSASPIDGVRALLATGWNGGNWNGNGIVTSIASTETAIGYAEASQWGSSAFSGQNVDSTSVLLKYTLAGDSNLDGKVNTLDFNQFAGGFGLAAGRWVEGDFDYDGDTDSTDFNRLSGNYGKVMTPMASLGTAVPEPSVLLPVSFMLAATCHRRPLRAASDVMAETASVKGPRVWRR